MSRKGQREAARREEFPHHTGYGVRVALSPRFDSDNKRGPASL